MNVRLIIFLISLLAAIVAASPSAPANPTSRVARNPKNITEPLTVTVSAPKSIRIKELCRHQFLYTLTNTGKIPLAIGFRHFPFRLALKDRTGKLRNDPFDDERMYKLPNPSERNFQVVPGGGSIKARMPLLAVDRSIRPGRYIISGWFFALPYGEWPSGIEKKYGRKRIQMWYGERVNSSAVTVQVVN